MSFLLGELVCVCVWGQFALDFMLNLWQIFGPSTRHQQMQLRLGRTHQKLSDSQCAAQQQQQKQQQQ